MKIEEWMRLSRERMWNDALGKKTETKERKKIER